MMTIDKTIAWLSACLLWLSSMPALAVDIYAHRGAAGLSPENTLVAMRTALLLGVDVIDMDVHLSKDEVVVISHDPRIDGNLTRNAAGEWLQEATPLNQLTYKEIAAFDVGAVKPGSFAAEKAPALFPQSKAVMPTLAAAIDFIEQASASQMRYQIELKTTPLKDDSMPARALLLARVLSILQAKHLLQRVELQSFDWQTLIDAKKQQPTLRTAFITKEHGEDNTVLAGDWGNRSWTANFSAKDFQAAAARMVAAAGGDVWNPHYHDLTARKVRQAHQLGLRVVPWTVNDERHMQQMIELGVDGIITDRPDKLRGILAARNFRLPTAVQQQDIPAVI